MPIASPAGMNSSLDNYLQFLQRDAMERRQQQMSVDELKAKIAMQRNQDLTNAISGASQNITNAFNQATILKYQKDVQLKAQLNQYDMEAYGLRSEDVEEIARQNNIGISEARLQLKNNEWDYTPSDKTLQDQLMSNRTALAQSLFQGQIDEDQYQNKIDEIDSQVKSMRRTWIPKPKFKTMEQIIKERTQLMPDGSTAIYNPKDDSLDIKTISPETLKSLRNAAHYSGQSGPGINPLMPTLEESKNIDDDYRKYIDSIEKQNRDIETQNMAIAKHNAEAKIVGNSSEFKSRSPLPVPSFEEFKAQKQSLKVKNWAIDQYNALAAQYGAEAAHVFALDQESIYDTEVYNKGYAGLNVQAVYEALKPKIDEFRGPINKPDLARAREQTGYSTSQPAQQQAVVPKSELQVGTRRIMPDGHMAEWNGTVFVQVD